MVVRFIMGMEKELKAINTATSNMDAYKDADSEFLNYLLYRLQSTLSNFKKPHSIKGNYCGD